MSTKLKPPTIAEAVSRGFSLINNLRFEMQEVCDGISDRLCDSEPYIEEIEHRISQFDSILSRKPDTESILKDLGKILVVYAPPPRRRRSWRPGEYVQAQLNSAVNLLESAHIALTHIKLDRERHSKDSRDKKVRTESQSVVETLNGVLGNLDAAIKEMNEVWFPDWYGAYQHFCCFEAA
jgi:hypothetical protein